MPRAVPLREALLVYAGVLAACMGTAVLARASGFVAEHAQVLVGAVFLVVALEMAHRDPGGPERLGLGLGGLLAPAPEDAAGEASEDGAAARERSFAADLARAAIRAIPSGLREAGVALALALVVFPPFVLGYLLWHRPPGDFALTLPESPVSFVASQLVAVALPEEAFFRGYLQTRLADGMPAGARTVRGVAIPAAAIAAQAALFAVVHFAFEPHPARLAVFFPALVFGLLRAARGGIGAAIVFHAACNVLADLLWRGFA